MKTVESYQAHIKEKMAFHAAPAKLVQHAIQWVISEKRGVTRSRLHSYSLLQTLLRALGTGATSYFPIVIVGSPSGNPRTGGW